VSSDVRSVYLADARRTFRNYKALGDRALAQVADADLHRVLGSEDNSVAVIVRHVAGNLRSRFTDFLTTDGEKPDRNRDSEFEEPEGTSRDELLAGWNAGWTIALAAIDALTPEDLDRTVSIRGEAFAVVEALNRSATHTAYHVGQIVLLAKHFAGASWKTLSIPKGRSADYSTGTFKRDTT
jgi:hypothetical protein